MFEHRGIDKDLAYIVICKKNTFITKSDSYSNLLAQIHYQYCIDPDEFDRKYGEVMEIYCLGGKVYDNNNG